MKRIVICLMAIVMLFSCVGCSDAQVTAADRSLEWLNERISTDTLFTFAYDGAPMGEHIGQWEKTVEKGENLWTLTYAKDGVKAWVEIKIDPEFSALDYCAYFENESDRPSLPISDIQIIDAPLTQKDAVMTSTVGSDASADDYMPVSVDLALESSFEMMSMGGRSSSGAWPYFDLCTENEGVVGALGWTGDWLMAFTNTAKGVQVRGGMKRTDIALNGGERMRTPSMVLLFFDGDQDAGHNQFRQLMLKSYTPSRNGETLTELPTFINNWGGLGITSHFTQVNQQEDIGVPFDGLWIDAGWYNAEPSENSHDTAWYRECGTWSFNAEMYPNGLTPLGEYLKQNDKDLMVWFEIERAMEGTQFLREHEAYYLPKSDKLAYRLYNLGDDEAREYLIAYLADLFAKNNITAYRQDFNLSPADTWANADALEGEHRVGITEIRYITGLYAFFDGLYEAIPNLLIDNCAAGGRRLDIEMMRRSVAYWPTDFLTHEGTAADDARNINYNLRWWLPIFGFSASREGRTTDYHLRCMYAAGVSLGTNVSDRTWYLSALGRLLDDRRFLTKDYYILASGAGVDTFKQNAAYQFYDSDAGEGILLVFRPRNSQTASQTYNLKGLDPDVDYEVTITETKETVRISGRDLMEKGLAITLDDPNTSTLITIKK